MLEKLLKGSGAELISQLGNQFNLDPSQAKKAADVSTETIKNGVLGEIKSGNFDGILSLLNGNLSTSGNALTNKLTNSLMGGLMAKVGLKGDIAQRVASFVVPFLIQKVSGNRPSGGFTAANLQSVLGDSTTHIIKDKAAGLLKGRLGGMFK